MSILQKNPGHDIYLNGYAVSYLTASPHQAPVYSGFLMPSELGQPTNSMCLVDNQKSTEELISFDQLGCFWKSSDDPNYKGRVHFLACNKDLGSVSENDAYRYEYAVIFMASPGDLSTNRRGKCIVDQVDFSFPLLDEEVVKSTWLPKQQTLDEHINYIIRHFFGDEDEFEEFGFSSDEIKMKTDEIKVDLTKRAQAALERSRKQKQGMIDSFFSSVTYTAKDLSKIQLFNVFPINLPAVINPKLPGKYMDQLWQQLGDNHRQVISDHYFSTNVSHSGLRRQLRQLGGDQVLNVFDINDTSSSTQLLRMLLTIDFLFATSGFGSSSNAGYTITHFLRFLSVIPSKFGIKRLIQFMGGDSSVIGNEVEMRKAHYSAYINKLVDETREAIESIGRPPSSPMDFLTVFLFNEPSGHQRDELFGAESIRLKASSKMLQLQVGVRWIDTDVRGLGKIVSKDGRNELLLHLLLHKSGHPLVIPSKIKASLLSTSDRVLSPSGKQRVQQVLPNHEIPLSQLIFKIEESVKTIIVKEIKANLHETAMTGMDEMLASFQDGGGNRHCVYINGSKGTITDPVEGFGECLPRTNESLGELDISEFSQVITVRRHKNELSERKRRNLQKKTGLPFF